MAVLIDADVMKWALNERPMTPSEADIFLASHFAFGDEMQGMHVISVSRVEEAIGFSGYRRCTLLEAEDVEFGWVIARQHHGRGYATELGRALIHHALDTLRLRRILAACNPANAPSEHILRDKLPMRFEREVEPHSGFRRRIYSAASEVTRASISIRQVINGPDFVGRQPMPDEVSDRVFTS